MVNPPPGLGPGQGRYTVGCGPKRDPTSTILLLAFLQISLFESATTVTRLAHRIEYQHVEAWRPAHGLWNGRGMDKSGLDQPIPCHELNVAAHPPRDSESTTDHRRGPNATPRCNTFPINRLRVLPVVGETLIQITAIKLHKGQCQKPNRRHHGQEIGPESHRTPPIAVLFTSSSIRTLTKTFTSSRN